MSDKSDGEKPRKQEHPPIDMGDCANQKKKNGQPSASLSDINPNPTPNHSDCASHQGKYSIVWWKTILEIVFFISAVPVAIFAGCQCTDTHKQLHEMQRASTLDERAWVFPFDTPVNIGSHSIAMSVLFKNFGRTPAIRVHGCIYETNSLNGIPKTDIEDTSECFPLAPDVADHFDIDLTSPTGIISDIKGGSRRFVYGTIWYDDIFGSNHWSQYCYFITRDLKFTAIARTHNDCDTNN